MGRPSKGPRIHRRSDRHGWWLTIDSAHRHISLDTEDEATARGAADAILLARQNRIVAGKARGLTDLSLALTDATRRRFLLRTRGHRCESCGRSLWQGKPIPLEMDHADGNSDNNAADNLRLLCLNCHALTPTHRGRNRGKTNSARSVRRRAIYQAGKSFPSHGTETKGP